MGPSITTWEKLTRFYEKIAASVSREFRCDDFSVVVVRDIDVGYVVTFQFSKQIYNQTYICAHEFSTEGQLDLCYIKRLREVMELKWAKVASKIQQELLLY